MGKARCEAPEIAPRPDSEVCLYNSDGSLSCFDPRANPPKYGRSLTIEDVVINIKDKTEDDKWLKSVLDACR